jgi:hypothetical protein
MGHGSSWVGQLGSRGYLVHSRDENVIPLLGVGLVGLIWVSISLQWHPIGMKTSIHTIEVDLVDDRARSNYSPILERAVERPLNGLIRREGHLVDVLI